MNGLRRSQEVCEAAEAAEDWFPRLDRGDAASAEMRRRLRATVTLAAVADAGVVRAVRQLRRAVELPEHDTSHAA